MKNKKQFLVAKSYTGNVKVITIVDGKIESCDIIGDYEQQGYCNRLLSEGYVQCYYVPELEKAYLKAKKELIRVKDMLDLARKNPVEVCDQDRALFYNLFGK